LESATCCSSSSMDDDHASIAHACIAFDGRLMQCISCHVNGELRPSRGAARVKGRERVPRCSSLDGGKFAGIITSVTAHRALARLARQEQRSLSADCSLPRCCRGQFKRKLWKGSKGEEVHRILNGKSKTAVGLFTGFFNPLGAGSNPFHHERRAELTSGCNL